MNNAYLIEGLQAGPEAMAVISRRIPQEQWDTPTGPERFTPREVIAHLADWESRLRGRMQSAISSPLAVVPAWDEGQLATSQNYAGSDWNERLATWVLERAATVAFLTSLEPEQFNAQFTHQERGPMAIDDQAAFTLGHDLYHLEQLSALI